MVGRASAAQPSFPYRILTQSYDDGCIDSPLEHCNDIELHRGVKYFYETNKLQEVMDLQLLQRGALLAKSPTALKNSADIPAHEPSVEGVISNEGGIPNVTTAPGQDSHNSDSEVNVLPRAARCINAREDSALTREQNGYLSCLTSQLAAILATCAVGAIAQGWAQECIVGANLHWPSDLNIANQCNGTVFWGKNNTVSDIKCNGTLAWNYYDSHHEAYPDLGLRYFSLVNGIAYFAASFVGILLIDPTSVFLGRRGALIVAALCSIAGSIGAATCTHWTGLMVCRLIQGIGMGAKASVVPIFESEVVPKNMRGQLLVLWQTFVSVGIFMGAVANMIFRPNWRSQMAITAVPALVLLCLCFVIPESPRWLIKKGKYEAAYRELTKLKETRLQAARDLYLIYAHMQLEASLLSGNTELTQAELNRLRNAPTPTNSEDDRQPVKAFDYFKRLWELFTIPRNLRAVLASGVVMSAQQFCGINLFAFLLSTLFLSPATEAQVLGMDIGFAAANVFFSSLAYWMVGRFGRQTLLLSSLAGMIPLLICIGAAAQNVSSSSFSGATITLVIIYTAIYSPGAGVIPFMYSSEVFGQTHREVGMSLAVFINLSLAGVLATCLPLFIYTNPFTNDERWTGYEDLMGTFTGLDFLALILVCLFMRTAGEDTSLEDMNYTFGAPWYKYMSYQVTHVAYEAIKRGTLQSFGEWSRNQNTANANPGAGGPSYSLHEPSG